MTIEDIKVPDIGDYSDIPIIEILVKEGDVVAKEDSIMTLESDKATMEIPTPKSGMIKKLLVNLGDKISQGVVFMQLEVTEEEQPSSVSTDTPKAVPSLSPPSPSLEAQAPALLDVPNASNSPAPITATPSPNTIVNVGGINKRPHAGPSVRKFAGELGVDLSQISGSGLKGRILREDINHFVKQTLSTSNSVSSTTKLDLLDWPSVDFSKYGAVEPKPLSRIKKISGANLHRNWVMIPHVTQHDEADITDLEAFRKQLIKQAEKEGVRVTLLVFLMKGIVAALKKFPEFNASLDGDQLILKKYFHIGVAVDTPNGLVVPVLRDCDQKGIFQLSKELAAISGLAREGKLKPTDMQGGCFSISSLGGIGGHYFTPIINAPEVAILGVSRNRSQYVPKPNGEFDERIMLPLSLSFDHRVIDGATAARFITYLGSVLADLRRAML